MGAPAGDESDGVVVDMEDAVPGAAALGILGLHQMFASQGKGEGVAFLTSRSADAVTPNLSFGDVRDDSENAMPTHVLSGDRAFPISEKPLIMSRTPDDDLHVCIEEKLPHGNTVYGSLQVSQGKVVLVANTANGISVNGEMVNGSVVLILGQRLRLSFSESELHLIACVKP